MSSNRLKYDDCAYKKEICQSVGPLEYNLYNGKYVNCTNCPSDREGSNSIDASDELTILMKPVASFNVTGAAVPGVTPLSTISTSNGLTSSSTPMTRKGAARSFDSS